jgi:signal transduction histidine kinase/CheY-like chemotaxis protein
MVEKIFESKFTLKYTDGYIESRYLTKRQKAFRKFNITLSVILYTISLPVAIYMILELCKGIHTPASFILAIFSLISLGINLLTLILSIAVKNKVLQTWVSYINYLLTTLISANYRFFLVFVLKVDLTTMTFIFMTELILKFLWYFLGFVDWVDGVLVMIVGLMVNCIIMGFLQPIFVYYRTSIYSATIVISTLLSYFYIRERKRSFYFNTLLRVQNEWYKSILDNMSSGFISLKGKQVQYFNKTLLTMFRNESRIADEGDIPLRNSLQLPNIDGIFNKLKIDANTECNTYDTVVDILCNKNSYDNFIFIGTKDMEISPSSEINLEIFGRRYCQHDSTNRYEFIFNDITRSKQLEQKNAEFKYKTLFLSKVAHEFKNPLLCISELVEQIYEGVVGKKANSEVLDIMKQAQAMCSYLIILIKDLDFFSQSSSGTFGNKLPEIDRVDISSVVRFCQDIVVGLLKKTHKDGSIIFQTVKDSQVPKNILTDEVKLKQILVNLLSNSVKYTQQGNITLKIHMDCGRVKFLISDTGKGISDAQKQKLFIPFSNEFDRLNKTSAGLGLSIVKDLLCVLRSHIEFESAVTKGSSFWFLLDTGQSDIEEINDVSDIRSEKTIVGYHFNEEPISKILSVNEFRHTILIIDDEAVNRQSTIRLLKKNLKERGILADIVEADDGLEGLSIFYNCVKKNKAISFIISDQTMTYLDGSYCAQILYNICESKNLPKIPFFIASAYENFAPNGGDAINVVYVKPLSRQNIEDILKFSIN